MPYKTVESEFFYTFGVILGSAVNHSATPMGIDIGRMQFHLAEIDNVVYAAAFPERIDNRIAFFEYAAGLVERRLIFRCLFKCRYLLFFFCGTGRQQRLQYVVDILQLFKKACFPVGGKTVK